MGMRRLPPLPPPYRRFTNITRVPLHAVGTNCSGVSASVSRQWSSSADSVIKNTGRPECQRRASSSSVKNNSRPIPSVRVANSAVGRA